MDTDTSSTGNNTIINPSPPKNPSLDPTKPHYLHPSENPGAIFVSPPLNENNYDSWSCTINRALFSKNKLKSINGKITIPPKIDPLFDVCKRCSNIVLSWIDVSLSPKTAQALFMSRTAQHFGLQKSEGYF